jgi:ribosomal protein S4E
MINVILITEIDKLKDIYRRLKNQQYPLTGMEITSKNSKIKYLKIVLQLIDGYHCYIEREYFDLRKDIIDMITLKVKEIT